MHRIPEHLRELADAVVAAAAGDSRMSAVIAGGSIATGTSDEYSDLDLVRRPWRSRIGTTACGR